MIGYVFIMDIGTFGFYINIFFEKISAILPPMCQSAFK